MALPQTRLAYVACASAYAIQALALTVLLGLTGARSPRLVVATFRLDARADIVGISSVDLGWALVIVVVGGAIVHTLAVRFRPQTMLIAGWSQGAGILVFLIAQLNGIAEFSSLIMVFALTAVAVILTGFDRPERSIWRRPAAWGAVAGIVPWGMIAFTQIGTTVALGGPSLGVRLVTILALALLVAGWVIAWRRSPQGIAITTMTVGVSLVVWAAAVVAITTDH